jgi:crossover junction endodeoxyribonuclease RuvC
MNHNVVCGLDLSLTSSGVVVMNGEEVVTKLVKTKTDTYPNSLARVEFIADTILGVVQNYKPGLIAVEDYFSGRNPKVVIMLCELGTIVRFKLLKAGFPFISVAPTQLKKYCYGSGGGGKEHVLKGIFKKWGIDVNSNDIADAYVLAHMARSLVKAIDQVPQQLLRYEQEVVDKILLERSVVR